MKVLFYVFSTELYTYMVFKTKCCQYKLAMDFVRMLWSVGSDIRGGV